MRFWLFFVVGIGMFAGSADADELTLPAGPDRDLVYGHCRTCHDLQYLKDSAGIPRGDWDATLDNMKQFGLRLPPDTRKRVLDYLATYLGPNPPKAAPAATEVAAASADGKAIFKEQCSACHQPQGTGVAGAFPPLAGNHDLFADRLFPVFVVLHGLEGKIDVGGHAFDGVMPPFGHLSDSEVAAVVGYVRSAWNNAALRPGGMAGVAPDDVKQARGKTMTSAQVHAYRASHR